MKKTLTGVMALAIAAALTNVTPAVAEEPLAVPDGKAADMTKPVQVFILMGQTCMLGFGAIGPEDKNGTLEHAVKTKKLYQHLVDAEGKWTTRKDVRCVHVGVKKGAMGVHNNDWLTIGDADIGPEIQVGHVLGQSIDAPVMVLKSCVGNRSLGWDLLPPGSKRYEYKGKIYAGYKESPSSWDKGTSPKPIGWYAGKQYDDDVANAKEVLADLGKYYPGAKDYEVAGFIWWQGYKDQNEAHANRYEQNLVQLIKQLRKDFDSPDAKFAIATIAFGGKDLSGHGLTIANAQLAVSGENGKYPEFKGNVKTIDARPMWRPASESPTSAGYYYNHNAETYMDVGDALGKAMVELLEK